MKQRILTMVLCLTATVICAGTRSPSADNNQAESLRRSNFAIDIYDTVVFDISQAVMAGNQVSFPVYLVSDDTINAIDFSLQFDETNFSLDSITNLTTYLQPTYNFTMGTLYFTSYSLQEIEHNIPIVSVSLNMLGHYLCSDDLDSLLVYLNGDPCSVKVIECLSDGISEASKGDDAVSVYPNPSSGMLNIETHENANVQLLDIRASQVLFQSAIAENEVLHINTLDMADGIYLVKIFNDNFVSVRKVLID